MTELFDVIALIKTLKDDRRGVTSVEYAVIAGVICLSLATAFTALVGKLNTFFNGLTL